MCIRDSSSASRAGCPFRQSAFFAMHAPALRAVARGLAPFPAGLLFSPCTLQRFALSLAGCPFRPSAFSALHAPVLRAVARGLAPFPPVSFLRLARSSASRCRSRAGALSSGTLFARFMQACRANNVPDGMACSFREKKALRFRRALAVQLAGLEPARAQCSLDP